VDEPTYITTPIYYVNDEPHLGHAYTTVLADVLARFARLRGRPTVFLTGTDEHGQKVERAARERGITPLEQANATVIRFQEAWQRLSIRHDDFIRTTETRHIRVVESALRALWDKGEIYVGAYEGWYCVPDERYWTAKDVVDGLCPDCGRPVERLSEKNYFFRMSAHQDWLVAHIEAHPDFIRPESRRNEVLGFLRQPLGDLCISRPAERLSWGIPLPFDADYVTYVWFDALLNYVTAALEPHTTLPGGADDWGGALMRSDARFADLWPRCIHLIGKDILTTHAVYWPTMLHALGLPQPRMIFAHGWWNVEGIKMSKSLGNVVRPLDLADVYGVDAFRYFLMREMTPGRDASFTPDLIEARYRSDLANDLGNLLNRLVAMTGRYCKGRIPSPGAETEAERALRAQAEGISRPVFEALEGLAVNDALALVMDLVGATNRYLEATAPWVRAKAGEIERVHTILYTGAEALRVASVLLSPVLPERMAVLQRSLGSQPSEPKRADLAWGLLSPGTAVIPGEPLFPKDVTA